ncbi:histidine kinase N-terminal 7TM domain-containing protein [Armatimonas rosea]|uniref:Histidine kinase N-terminal 7TM region domain-containing protein n=1 Tax=Armatimonas rosea TaxID=685828 RepID=A0A7W9SXR9_ARMRO|nr:histidine kinase N-terminal 7TM domain-containing protein [Armatimonas rosea]MBB6053878.1 hypothetical protein [Armatimonas rosea]
MAGILLASASLYLWIREHHSEAARWFVGTCVALFGWTATLYVFQHLSIPEQVLLVGRLNFAAASLAVYGVYRLVRAVAGLTTRLADQMFGGLTLLVALVSTFTPWVDQAEHVSLTAQVSLTSMQVHQTVYGPLFPLYAAHLLGLLGGAILLAFSERRKGMQLQNVRDQLLLLGVGILATGAVSIITNVLLPYVRGDFRWIDVGPLSTLLLLLAVGYAVVQHQLFDIKVLIRRTLVLGMALSLVLAAYSALVLLATDSVGSSESGGVTRFGVLVLAFSFDPIRRFLEKRIDKLLFPERSHRR